MPGHARDFARGVQARNRPARVVEHPGVRVDGETAHALARHGKELHGVVGRLASSRAELSGFAGVKRPNSSSLPARTAVFQRGHRHLQCGGGRPAAAARPAMRARLRISPAAFRGSMPSGLPSHTPSRTRSVRMPSASKISQCVAGVEPEHRVVRVLARRGFTDEALARAVHPDRRRILGEQGPAARGVPRVRQAGGEGHLVVHARGRCAGVRAQPDAGAQCEVARAGVHPRRALAGPRASSRRTKSRSLCQPPVATMTRGARSSLVTPVRRSRTRTPVTAPPVRISAVASVFHRNSRFGSAKAARMRGTTTLQG